MDYAWTVVSKATEGEPVAGVQTLVAPVVAELNAAWRRGEAIRTEDLLARHPECQENLRAILRILYEEILLRLKAGRRVSLAELTGRFPQWQAEVADLLASFPAAAEPADPQVGDIFDDFTLVRELGRGTQGRVFLARHRSLANRLVVLKITPCDGEEHLSLARLQHTHIVPLYAAQNDEGRRLRILVFPYLGRVTWKQLLDEIRPLPLARRLGRHLVTVLEQAEEEELLSPQPAPTRELLQKDSYVQAVCRLGACLADTLHYAHQRGLLHLDVKPSNVLLTTDGQALLLDFHLAQPPIAAGRLIGASLGGTPGYMAPEHQRALAAADFGRTIPHMVDGRADLYSLGSLLYESLSGRPLKALEVPPPLHSLNPQVSVGLSDIIHKCLAPAVADRYADGALLAEDLRRHLDDLPLRGVRNRSMQEHWYKWRRRRPLMLPLVGLTLALFGALLIAGALILDRHQKRRQLAEEFFIKGRALLQQQQFPAAQESLTRGRELLEGLGTDPGLACALDEHLRLAERAAQANKLHQIADSLRHHMLFPTDDQRTLIVLDVGCRQIWEKRDLLLSKQSPLLEPLLEQRLLRDLGDVAVGWAEIRVLLAPPGSPSHAERYEEALALLTEAASWGARFPEREWQRYQRAGIPVPAFVPRTGWEFFLAGRALLRAGECTAALALLENAVLREPACFPGNYCLGVCAARLGRHPQAVAAFSVCIGQNPMRTEPFLFRGRSHAHLQDWRSARADFDRALRIRPNVPEVLLERAQACCQLNDMDQACKDAELVLTIEPCRPEALQLLERIRIGR
jgi:serine/threonine protein kinase